MIILHTQSRRRFAASRASRGCAAMGLALMLLPLAAVAGEKPGAPKVEPLPSDLKAHYKLLYNGIGVGHLHIASTVSGSTYALSGSGKVSALFGAMTWSGSSSVSGRIDGGEPAPRTYAFDWRHNRKNGAIKLGFASGTAVDISVSPPPGPHPDLVPLAEAHKTGAIDPVSAILALTRPDGRPPCNRRVAIFDGKQRYDIVLTPKRTTELPASASGGEPQTAVVCRAMYEPIAGHRANAANKTYATNWDVEVVMRRVPGSAMHVPYSVTIPTAWGTGSMVTERVEIVSPTVGRIALTR